MEPLDYSTAFRYVAQLRKLRAHYQEMGEPDYPSCKGRSSDYAITFAPLLSSDALKLAYPETDVTDENDVLQRLVASIEKRNHRKVRVLDLFSNGIVLDDLNVAGCSVSLAPRVFSKENEHKVYHIQRNVFSSLTWKILQKNARDHGKFDIVLCRPLGVIYAIHHDTVLYRYFLNNCSTLMSQGGVLMTEISHTMIHTFDSEGNFKFQPVKFMPLGVYSHRASDIVGFIKL